MNWRTSAVTITSSTSCKPIVEILGFYHPAVWWVLTPHPASSGRNCCDDLAVQVCGNSLQYARALACMEAIRHHEAELAITATGGTPRRPYRRCSDGPAPKSVVSLGCPACSHCC